MQNYRVDGGTLHIGQGAVIGLSDQQAEPRAKRIEKMGEGVYRVRENVEFKSGETIRVGLDDIPKHLRAISICLDPAPEAPAGEAHAKPRKSAKAHA